MPVPLPPTPLIGRDAEIEFVEARLKRGARLLTLVGSPGVGKTRLALQIAQRRLEAGDGEVVFVPLDTISDPDFVPAGVARALEVREDPGRPPIEAVQAYLRDRQALLVLDNFEQVLPAAVVVGGLLETCPGLQVLVTSRAPLHLRAEELAPLEPLALPATDATGRDSGSARSEIPSDPVERAGWSAAVQLFVERAHAVRPSLTLSASTVHEIVAICVGLDGLPLALELAAARARLMSLREIVERLRARLSLLIGGPLDAPVRQRTLRAAIDWSYELLAPQEQHVFRLMSVFAGGCTYDAITSVCCDRDEPAEAPAWPTVLEALVDQSLVQRREDAHGTSRFVMLETIREYATERLEAAGQADSTRLQLAAWFLIFARRAARGLGSADQLAWAARLEAEHDNIRAVLQWTLEGDRAPLGMELAGSMWPFWHARGYLSEGRRWIERLLESGGTANAALRAACLAGAARLAEAQGDFARAAPLAERSLALHREFGGDGLAESLMLVGALAFRRSDYEAARSQAEESLALAEAAGDRPLAARCLSLLGAIAIDEGQFLLASEYLEAGLAHARAVGDLRTSGIMLNNLGLNAHRMDDYVTARDYLEQALVLQRQLGNKTELVRSLCTLAMVARGLHDPESGLGAAREALALAEELQNEAGMASALGQLTPIARDRGDLAAAREYSAAHLDVALTINYPIQILSAFTEAALNAQAEGDGRRAVRLFAAADAQRETMGLAQHPGMREMLEGHYSALIDQIGAEAFSRAWADGAAMSQAEAIAHALAPGLPERDFAVASPNSSRAPESELAKASRAWVAPFPDGLTERQVEILRLVAAGRSNHEIAERLVISERTVEHHVKNIYRKIDVAGRVEAAAYALQHGLVGT